MPAHSVDAVVATFVLCSVDDVTAALAEIRRVLRPGARYVLAEHVAAPEGSWVRRGQDGWARASRWFGAQCRPNRSIGPAIERAGFALAEVHRFVVPGPLGAGIPHLAGAAVCPADTGKGTTS
ncbi:class I SAM-dependent methyltransferase [Prauserella flavalba]|uniref:class I SAM-dependent methyltransferase n=1 Tax=Prauserella flavalba TaxID=1477506 RepID=UPI0036E15792